MAEKGASGGFDYRREESDGSDGVDVFDEENDHASEADFDYVPAEGEAQQGDGFDAFDENNWVEVLNPVPTPWYRSPQARILLIASGIALSAIVISVVLLMFRPSPTGDKPVPAAPTTTPVTTPMATATSEQPPPPPPPSPPPSPPPPPPPPEPSTMETAPAVPQPTVQPKPTKQPEIGVTRTPATRAPMSVAPQPRRPRS